MKFCKITMIRPILEDPNPILHKISLPITQGFRSNSLKKLIKDMKDTLHDQDGLGLAAPQIGESLSIFVIPESMAPAVKTPMIPMSLIKPLKPTVFINPEIIFLSKGKETMDEGCLSVKGIFRPTSRYSNVKLKALDEKGRKFTVSVEGLLARVFQHETDHLNGVLFIEKL